MIDFSNISKDEGLTAHAQKLSEKTIRLRLENTGLGRRNHEINEPMIFRLALLTSLADAGVERKWASLATLNVSGSIHPGTFSRHHLRNLWSTFLKLRWRHENPNWNLLEIRSRIINWEILRGIELLHTSEALNYINLPLQAQGEEDQPRPHPNWWLV